MANSEALIRSTAKGIAGMIPGFGSLVAEAVDTLIPDLRRERFEDFVLLLNQKISDLGSDVERLERVFREGESLDLFVESGVQASRATSKDRRAQIAAILAYSLLDEEAEYDRSRKILSLFSELTDSEVILLKSLSLRGQERRDFHQKHSAVLRPASRTVGVPRAEADRRATQDAFQQTLIRLGLAEATRGPGVGNITALGRLLLRYIETEPRKETKDG